MLLAGCAPLAAVPPPGLAFGLLGDTPYSEPEAERLDARIDEINAQQLAFVVHVGDIGTAAQACSDRWREARRLQFARIRHPFVLLPGDNEWTDCGRLGFDPAERLKNWRRMFCVAPHGLAVERQPGPYCEHLRWEAGGTVFVTLNVPGSNNNVRNREHPARMAAVLAWLAEAAALAEKRSGLVILMQANPFVTTPRDGYAALRARLQALAERRPGRITLVHGDTHLYRNDEPLPGLRRIEVWGSPFVDWLRGTITAGELSVEQAR